MLNVRFFCAFMSPLQCTKKVEHVAHNGSTLQTQTLNLFADKNLLRSVANFYNVNAIV